MEIFGKNSESNYVLVTSPIGESIFCEAIMHVTIEAAEAAIQAARKHAMELGTEMCIAIVDSGANLKAFYRMDAAWVGSIDIAIKKARRQSFSGCPGQIASFRNRGLPFWNRAFQ